MVEVNPAGWFQALSTHTAEQLRTYVGNTFAVPQGLQSLKTLGAVHPGLGTAMAVTQNGTPNMTVNVGAGSCWISGTETTKQGTYFCQNDAAKSLTIAASDPTLNRIDLVVAKVQDAAYSGSINAWSLVIVQGTAAGSPATPAAPANSIILAQVLVSAAVSSITTGAITDTRPWNAALGGVVPCTSTVRPANPYNGLYAHELDTSRTVRYNGTNWHQLGIHVCTAATRPAGPFTGMFIYETDTDLTWRWNGTAWVLALPYIKETTLVGAAANVIFSSIPSTLKTLRIEWTASSNAAVVAQQIWMRINGDATASYDSAFIELNASAAPAKTTFLAAVQTVVGVIPGNTATAGVFGSGVIDITGWDSPHSANLGTNFAGQFVQDATNLFVISGGGRYRPVGPYTSVTLLPQAGNFIAGTRFTLSSRG